MFLFDNLNGKSKATAPPELAEPDDAGIKARSLLSWEEHCVECAAPACYTSCDLYDPTPNGKCRRFEGGILELPTNGRSLAHIKYKKWGKLEARGNGTPVPQDEITALEKRLGWAASMLNRVGSVIGKLPPIKLYANLSERLMRKLNARQVARSETVPGLASTFEAEIFNPGAETIQLQLAMIVDQTRLPRSIAMADQPRAFRQVLEVEPGPNRFCIPGSQFAELIGSGLPFLVQLTSFDERLPEVYIGTLDFVWRDAENLVETVAHGQTEASASRPKAKCVVFDLDNTLWDGILLEGNVKLRDGIAELFSWLDERGILISVASKNAESDALVRLKLEGLDEFLLHPQIGWNPKSMSIQRIASLIDIGIDTFIFVDDNPFERAQVSETLPQVEVLAETAIPDLREHPRLAGGVTPESKRRRAMYQEAAVREQAAEQFTDYQRFLADCEIVLEIRPDVESDFERIAELVQRTNQLNFSGRKYDREAISDILADQSRHRFVVVASDRFGAYGTVGFCLASRDGDTVVVEDFMLSCRVQGKYVEQALFAYLANYFSPDNEPRSALGFDDHPSSMHVNFRPTPRNAAALKVLETLKFEAQDSGGFARKITRGDLEVDFMTINP